MFQGRTNSFVGEGKTFQGIGPVEADPLDENYFMQTYPSSCDNSVKSAVGSFRRTAIQGLTARGIVIAW
jgi:hypothetical protein